MEMNKNAIVHVVSNIINSGTEVYPFSQSEGSIYETVNVDWLNEQLKASLQELMRCSTLECDEAILDNHKLRFSEIKNALLQISNNESVPVIRARLIIFILMRIRPFSELKMLPSLDTEGRFSYSRNADDTDSKRTSTTFGRIVRRQLMIPAYAIKDDVLTKLSEIVVQRIWTDETDVEEIFGNEIITAYEHYTGPSCMNGDRCIFMGTCAKNESKVSLLTARDSHGEFVAKALLWRTDQGGLFLDRVYHHDRHYSKGLAIVGYARSLDADVPENPFAGRLNSHKTVTLDFSKCDYVPYFDSFVSVLKQNEDLTEVVLSTDGFVDLQSPRGRGRYVCVNCRTRHIGRICPKCDSDYILSDNIDGIECGHCGSCDLVERIEDGNRTFYVCDECLEEYHS